MEATEEIRHYYRVKVTDYANSNGEISVWYDEPLGREERRFNQLYPLPRTARDEIPEDEREDNLNRAFRRAKSKVRKLIMTMGADRMLTLTFRENLTDREEANKIFVRYIKMIHQHYPNWQYVAVAEKQKRGAWHYHVAVKGFQDVGFLRSTWRKLADGNIDVTSPRTRGDKDLASASIAAYITKYMSKAFIENYEHGKYRYRASNGIQPRTASFWLKAESYQEAVKAAAALMDDLYGKTGSHFFSEDWSSFWLASWSLRR